MEEKEQARIPHEPNIRDIIYFMGEHVKYSRQESELMIIKNKLEFLSMSLDERLICWRI